MLQEKTALFLLWIFSWLPFRVCQWIGRRVGALLWRFDARGRAVALTNLKLAFPERSEAERKELAQASFKQIAQTFIESAHIWQNPPQSLLSRVVDVKGRELLDEVLNAGGRAIIAGPHLGNWEVIGLFLGQYYSCVSMYRPPNQPFLENVMQQGREASGAILVPANRKGVVQMVRHLSLPGKVAGILPDQDPAEGEGVFAPFFGVETNTMTLLSRLANRSRATVFLGYTERLPRGKFQIHLIPISDEMATAEVRRSLTLLNAAIESEVRRLPEQYLWLYKRFKTRPEGEPKIYA